jgi:hypothetical protein
MKKLKKVPRKKSLYNTDKAEWDRRRDNGLKLVIDLEFLPRLTDKEITSLKH